jgi:hypothetical protein
MRVLDLGAQPGSVIRSTTRIEEKPVGLGLPSIPRRRRPERALDEPADGDLAEDPADATEADPAAPGADEDDQGLIALVEQGFEWFTEERVPFEEDAELWQDQGSVESITGFRVLGSDFLVETGLHRDNPDSEWVAQGLCGVTASSLYRTDIRRVEVEASNGNRLARCDVLG